MQVEALTAELSARKSRLWSVVSPEDVASWVFDDSEEYDAREPIEAMPDAVERVEFLQRMLDDPAQDSTSLLALGFAGDFLRCTVPAASATRGKHWVLTRQAGSGETTILRLTVGISEVCIARWDAEGLWVTYRVAESPIRQAIAAGSLDEAEMARRGVQRVEDTLKSHTDDAARFVCLEPDAALWFANQPAVITAARMMNARLSAGTFPFAEAYKPELALDAWAAAEIFFVHDLPDDEPDEASQKGDDPQLPHQPAGHELPYSGRPEAAQFPPVQAVNAMAHEAGRDEHDHLCRLLLDRLAAAGLTGGQLRSVPVDLAWQDATGKQFIAEAKSIAAEANNDRLRLGLGQILEYRQRLALLGVSARAVLLVSHVRDPLWYDVCASVDVLLVAATQEDDWARLFRSASASSVLTDEQ